MNGTGPSQGYMDLVRAQFGAPTPSPPSNPSPLEKGLLNYAKPGTTAIGALEAAGAVPPTATPPLAPIGPGRELAPPPPPEPPAPPVLPNGPPMAMGGGPPRSGFPLMRVGGGGVATLPAKETDLRGPHLKEAQAHRDAAYAGAIDAVAERSQQTAAVEFAQAYNNEIKAKAREDAVNYSAGERNEELAQRQADFDQSVKALSAMKDQPDYYASKSAPQKMGMVIALALGGFLQGRRGGENPAMTMLNADINRDLHQQEMRYKAAMGTAQAKQTAFGLAMEKYKNEDAARAMARAAMLDGVQAQMAQQAAMWKGTEAANRASMAIADIEQQKLGEAAQFFRFTPQQQVAIAPRYYDPETDMILDEKHAQEVAKAYRGHQYDLDKGAQGIAGKILEKGSEDVDKGATFIAEKLQTAGVPQARAAAERAMASLNKSPGGKLEAGARWAGGPVAPMLAGRDSNNREQDYWAFKNAAMKAIAGNVTAGEEARLERQFGSATDPESRKHAIQSALDTLGDIEKNIKAGASPKAQRTFEDRRKAAEGTPALAPKGATQGWK